MYRTLQLSLALALGVVVSAPAYATLINEVEPNSGFATAQNLNGHFSTDFVFTIFNSISVPHASVSGAIGPAGGTNDVDYYRFTVATAGSIGYFDIDGGGLADSSLSLFDSGFNLLGFNDDSLPSDFGSATFFDSFVGTYTFGSAGEYYVAVSSAFNYPLASGIVTGNLTRPDGGNGGQSFAGSGPTSVETTDGSEQGAYTLHASLSSPVPLPAAVWLFGSGLAGIGLAGWRRRRSRGAAR